jgi:hypothetical protein
MLPPMLRVIVTVASVSFVLTGSAVSATRAAGTAPVRLVEAYGKLPLHFEANQGQTDRQVQFLSRGAGYTLFLTQREAVLTLTRPKAEAQAEDLSPVTRHASRESEQSVLRLRLVGANPAAPMRGLDELPGKANYFVGKDPTKWRTNVPTYAKVTQSQVYPGIDLVYYGNQRQLEFDLIVAPGANPNAIRLKMDGADRLEVDAQGDLRLRVATESIKLQRPRVYQDADGVRTAVSGHYVLQGTNEVGFEVAAYNRSRPLVIDPALVYATYLGGSRDDRGWAISVDAAGAAYVTGFTPSADFTADCTAPCTVLDATFGGGPKPSPNDAFVTKLNATGTALVYSTYLGGSSLDFGFGIAVDAEGAAYVTGRTISSDFPVVCTAPCTVLDSTLNGGDAFVTKLNATGTALLYSTYLGGSRGDDGFGIAVDAAGAAYVTGTTDSIDFTAGCMAPCMVLDATLDGPPPVPRDAFVTKLNATGTALVYSTYLGGSSTEEQPAISVDAEGQAYVTGRTFSTDFPTGCTAPCAGLDSTLGGTDDAFVTKLNATGTALLYSTYLGGSSLDFGFGIAVDAEGAAYVTGRTFSADFTAGCMAPCTGLDSTLDGNLDAFVTKLNATGTALVYSTYLGGRGSDSGSGIAVDTAGAAYVTGVTGSPDFTANCTAPCTVLDSTPGNGVEAFVTKLNATGTALVYSTYLGGTGDEVGNAIAVDAAGATYVTGSTSSRDFTAGCTPPCTVLDATASGAGQFADAFIVKISHVGAPAMLTLSPEAATNPVKTQHCVTAMAQDALGNPTPGITVQFSVTGSVTTSGAATTDTNGQATFCYPGPRRAGRDSITAHADTDSNTVQDSGEPTDTGITAWVKKKAAKDEDDEDRNEKKFTKDDDEDDEDNDEDDEDDEDEDEDKGKYKGKYKGEGKHKHKNKRK